MINLKPFDLQKALAGDKVVTRDGLEVLAIFLNDSGKVDDDCLVSYVVKENGEHDLTSVSIDGTFYQDRESSANDIFMLPKVTTYWANVYKSISGSIEMSSVYESKEHAVICAKYSDHYIKTISFEIEHQ